MSPIDFDRINAAAVGVLESLLHEWLPAGRKEGHEYKIGDLHGSPGRSLSINLNTGVWRDFSSDVGGSDPISLLAAIRNCGMGEAARELDDKLRAGGVAPKPAKASPGDEWEPEPQDGIAPPSDVRHPRLGRFSKTWWYPGHGLICRFETPEGKDVLPFAWCKSSRGERAFRWKSFAKPRPLYNLPALEERPNAGVLIVEGEKAADAAARLMPKAVVVSWPGGSKAIRHTDWSPLRNRRVFVWPDADKPGMDAAEAILAILPQAQIILPPADVAEGWDLADAEAEGWTPERVAAWGKDNIKRDEPDRIEEPERIEEHPPYYDEAPPEAPMEPDGMPFDILGHDSGTFFYLPHSGRQIVELAAASHKKLGLLQLAPAHWWEAMFPSKNGADFDAAANSLIQRSYSAGIFDPRRIRGRGAWIDDDNVVFHAGDRLVIDGNETNISTHRSRYIYELGHRIEADQVAPATAREAGKLLELCGKISWADELSPKLLAGWCVLAPICGSLRWRPHIWVNGPSGTGKTWIFENVIKPIVGDASLFAQSSTTEAGIRQTLRSDALPVILDEAESEDKRGQARMQSILELARQASTETGAGILKGTASGKAMEFMVRSCFAFLSIGVAAVQRADTSRITNLELVKRGGEEGAKAFDEVKAAWRESIGQDGFAARIRARSLTIAPIIRDNAKAFGRAVASRLGDQRFGDQIGTLLAGAYSLTSARKVDVAFAAEWVAMQDWSAFETQAADADENRAFAILADSHIRIDATKTLTIAELVQRSRVEHTGEAAAILLRHGVKIERDETVSISNTHEQLRRVFSDTQFAGKWKDFLGRVQGARHIAAVRFGASMHRAVRIPMSEFLEE
jgi:putative DNA primase/helicase